MARRLPHEYSIALSTAALAAWFTLGVARSPTSAQDLPAGFGQSAFEAFPVIASIPTQPRGLVFVFHGSGGSSRFAARPGTVPVLRALLDEGYGFVATDSTQREPPRRWNVLDLDLTRNADLARLLRLHDHLIATGEIARDTPLFTMGMSNGATMALVTAAAFAREKRPIRAAAAYEGGPGPAGDFSGWKDYRVASFIVAAENDWTVKAQRLESFAGALKQWGVPVEFHLARERPLARDAFAGLPGVDAARSASIVDDLVNAGVVDASGKRLLQFDTAATSEEAVLPAPAGYERALWTDVRDVLMVTLAVHKMRPDYRDAQVAFFEKHR
jgi:dienelactone hydrolase